LPHRMCPELAKHDLPARQLGCHDAEQSAVTCGPEGLDDLQCVEIAAEQRGDNQFQRSRQGQMRGKLFMADRHRLTTAGQALGKGGIGDPDDKAAQCVGQGFDRTFITKRSRDASCQMIWEPEAADRPFIQRSDVNHFTDTKMLTRIAAVTRCRSLRPVKERV
jgi:hypothetical protein